MPDIGSKLNRSVEGSVGLYQLQAAIAAVRDEAARAEDTDWPQIPFGKLRKMYLR